MTPHDFGPFGGAYILFVVFLVVLAIVWILLPFAIFGIKPKLDALVHQMRQSNERLNEIAELLHARNVTELPAHVDSPPSAPVDPSP